MSVSTPTFSKQLSLNKFFDPSTREGGEKGEKQEKWEKREKWEKADGNSGHYVIPSSQPPERPPLECRTLVPIPRVFNASYCSKDFRDKLKHPMVKQHTT